MKISVDNLYSHPDGGFYCLLIPDAPMKHPDTGDWLRGVIYIGTDGQARSTTQVRWDERFTQVPSYDGEDEDVLSMIRRANPGDSDLDFVRVFESWHESEINITGNMLELAVAVALVKWQNSVNPGWDTEMGQPGKTALTITTEDLQQVLQNYDISRTAEPHGFKFEVRKSFPDSA